MLSATPLTGRCPTRSRLLRSATVDSLTPISPAGGHKPGSAVLEAAGTSSPDQEVSRSTRGRTAQCRVWLGLADSWRWFSHIAGRLTWDCHHHIATSSDSTVTSQLVHFDNAYPTRIAPNVATDGHRSPGGAPAGLLLWHRLRRRHHHRARRQHDRPPLRQHHHDRHRVCALIGRLERSDSLAARNRCEVGLRVWLMKHSWSSC
jgi:hypothetical protein